jgi:hypothetical protein
MVPCKTFEEVQTIFLRSLEERIFIISRYFETVLRAIWMFIPWRI